jgi:hypothetical protein
MEIVPVTLIEWRVGSSKKIFLIRDGLFTSMLARMFFFPPRADSRGQLSNDLHEFGHPQVNLPNFHRTNQEGEGWERWLPETALTIVPLAWSLIANTIGSRASEDAKNYNVLPERRGQEYVNV